mgnify:CR=1 FL=1
MKISAFRLFNVKRFAGRGVAVENIGDGVNVLCAANEFGKSTSFEALHALFFQPYSSTAADVRSLRPYSGGNPRVGVLRFETTRGDRLFIGLLSAAFIHLGGIGFTTLSIWIALALSAVWLLVLMRWG